MKTLLLIFSALMLLASAGRSQTGSVAGKVMLDSGDPAVGATIMLADTKLGVSAREDGSFVISAVTPGSYTVEIRLIGYVQDDEELVTVLAGDTARVQLVLRQSALEMNPVTVTGSRRQDARDTRASVTTISPRESKYLPGAAEDVMRSLQALPGVTSVSDFSSQLVVRGSGPDQNLILIDGFEVLNPYRLYGFVSMFNPETITDISLQAGGFAAQYGDRLSSVLDVKNREGRSDASYAGKINASLTNMNLVVEGGLPLTSDGSYLLSFRRTYYDLILGPVLKSAKLVAGDVALPNFRDLQAKVAIPLNRKHKLLFNAVTSRDGVELISGVERDQPDSVNVFDSSTNTLLGGTWLYNPSKNVLSQTRISWYRNSGAGMFDGSFVDPSQNTGDIGRGDTLGLRFFRFAVNYDYVFQKTSLSQQLLWNRGNHILEGGFGADFLRTDFTRYFQVDETFKEFLRSRGLVVPVDAVETITYNRYHAFVQDRIAITERLFLQPGMRMDFYPVLERKIYLAPRVNVSYSLNDASTLRAAYGTYYQSPGHEKQNFQTRLSFSSDIFNNLIAERATHYILGYDRMLTPEWQFKTETYYKHFSDVVIAQKLSGSEYSSRRTDANILTTSGWTVPERVQADSLTNIPTNEATGKSYGFEVLLQKIRSGPTEKFTGWVSYAYSFSERDRRGIKTAFLFDQRHAANIVGNYKFADHWDIGMRFTLRSGRPFVEATEVKPRILVATVAGADTAVIQVDSRTGKVILDVEYERDKYSGRLNLYHSLDLRVTHYPQWWGLDWAVYLDVQNVYNHKNQQQITYYVNQDGDLRQRVINGIPIFPSLGLSLVF